MEEIGGPIIETRSISCSPLLSALTFKIFQGEAFGLLASQGAGKSTLMRILSCTALPSSGSLFVCGRDASTKRQEIKARIGVVPEEDLLDEDFSALENLLLFCRYHRLPSKSSEERARGLLREMEMEDTADLAVSRLRPALRRRLMICRSLLNEPQVLFLDEPTKNLAANEQNWIWRLLLRLKNQLGVTVVLASNNRREIEKVCDRVALMDEGKILQIGRPESIVKEVVGPEVLEFLCRRGDLEYCLSRIKDRYRYQVIDNRVCVFLNEGQEARQALSYVSGVEMVIRRASLDDVYLKLTGQNLKDFELW